MPHAVVHYHEIALKGKNRPMFVERLTRNIRRAGADVGVHDVRALPGRILVTFEDDARWPQVAERLGRVFGIANFARAERVAPDLDALRTAIWDRLAGRSFESFRVLTRRADKSFPLTSPQIDREVGGAIKQRSGARVDLERPELTIYVEMLPREALFCFDKVPGAGGLPSGVSGRVACLLSGGIDSPVAAYRMMKRGCEVLFVHFHGYPILSRASMDKAAALADLLTRYQYRGRLWLVPFGEVQREVVLAAPPPLRVILYRRLMVRIAETIARRNRARALVTGEVVGQVASQTLDNIDVIDRAANLPILRPLIGMDKDEITAQAQRLGTFEISIVPDQDCCQLFMPRRPATRARLDEVEAVEAGLEIARWVEDAVARCEVREFRFPAASPSRSQEPGARSQEAE